MKHVILVSLALAVFAFLFPFFSALEAPVPAAETEAVAPATDGPVSAAPASSETPAEGSGGFDEATVLSMLVDGETASVTMRDYLIGAVAAEMPAGFEPDALMAQAAALRTYVLYKTQVSPSSAHAEDICTDSSCCAAWRSEAALREKWGGDYDEYIVKIADAVKATDGIYITYGGEPALAAFHSSSAGATESSEAVWSSALPYLVSVSSPETAEDVPNYVSSVTVLASDFADTVRSRFPKADFSGDVSGWISGAVYDASGRLSSVSLGGVSVSGTELRSLFSLRSAAAELSAEDGAVRISVTGYGHGVGMSQYGANVMAENGSTWEDILAWYYPGTALVNANEKEPEA